MDTVSAEDTAGEEEAWASLQKNLGTSAVPRQCKLRCLLLNLA